jgi:hypothetical protein
MQLGSRPTTGTPRSTKGERGNGALGFFFRSRHRAEGEKRAAATERAP